MKDADLLEVYRRLGEARVPFLDERAHKPIEMEEPLFLKEIDWLTRQSNS